MNAVVTTVSTNKKYNTYNTEDNNLYCNRYRATHKEKFNEYMREYTRTKMSDESKRQIVYRQTKLRWYKNNIALLEHMESLTKRQTGRLTKLKKLQTNLLHNQSSSDDE